MDGLRSRLPAELQERVLPCLPVPDLSVQILQRLQEMELPHLHAEIWHYLSPERGPEICE